MLEEFDYWQRQDPGKPLFAEIEWNKPEQRQHAGNLCVIGGTTNGFAAVAEAYQTATSLGVGQVRAVVPAGLQKAIPTIITNVMYAESTPSGAIASNDALLHCANWAGVNLLIGDSGRSSETAVAFEHLLRGNATFVITRDAADLLRNSAQVLVNRPSTGLVLSFAQLQKLFQSVYYPKMLTFSMQLTSLVEALHKFTLTYPNIWLATYHHGNMVVAAGGQITTTQLANPMAIWRGTIATRAACYWLWNPSKPLQAVTTAIL